MCVHIESCGFMHAYFFHQLELIYFIQLVSQHQTFSKDCKCKRKYPYIQNLLKMLFEFQNARNIEIIG